MPLRRDTAGKTLASIKGTVPINLALSGVTGSRLLDLPINAKLVSDSLPLALIPQFTDAVSDMGGRALGNVTVGGTLKKPALEGSLTLDRRALQDRENRHVLRACLRRDTHGEGHRVR